MDRRPRPQPPDDDYRRSDLAAAAAVAVVLAHLLFAQVTLILAVAFFAVSRISRWRPLWLAVPAGAGLVWACAIGPGRALAGFTAGPAQVAGYLSGTLGHPAALLRFSRGYAGAGHWLPRQFPVALIAAAAEALAAQRLAARRSGQAGPYRAGLIVALRRRRTAAALTAGDTVTATGACLGLEPATGRPAAITWGQARRGVLVTGPEPAALAQTAAALAGAALRRRKAMIVIDLDGRAAPWLPAACAAAGAPLRTFGPAGPGCYEPVRGSRPERTAGLALAMIDWSGVTDAHRRSGTAYLTDACAVQAAVPAPGGRPVLDDLAGLLQPGALRARAAAIPPYHGRARVLADRAEVSAALLAADPGAVAAPAEQLARLRGSALGHWLRPAPPPDGDQPDPVSAINLSQAVRERAVVSFALDQAVHGRAARMVAALALTDLLDLLGELQAMGVRTDCLAWISGCESLPAGRLAELVQRGGQTGTAVLLTTTSAAAAAGLAGAAGVVAVRGPVSEPLGTALAGQGGSGPVAGGNGPAPAGPGSAAGGSPDGTAAGPAGSWLADDDSDQGTASWAAGPGAALTLLVRGPRGRLVTASRAVAVAGRPR
jgi:hypothetical protein